MIPPENARRIVEKLEKQPPEIETENKETEIIYAPCGCGDRMHYVELIGKRDLIEVELTSSSSVDANLLAEFNELNAKIRYHMDNR